MRRVPTLFLSLSLTLSLLAIIGCESIQNAVYKAGIQKAIHEDALTGTEPTTSHVAAMRKVDLENCPPDFRTAYSKHIHAWEEEAVVRDAKVKLDSQEDAAAAAGVLASLFGSDETPWTDHVQAEAELKKYQDIATSDVRSTWRDVGDIAIRYNVQVPN